VHELKQALRSSLITRLDRISCNERLVQACGDVDITANTVTYMGYHTTSRQLVHTDPSEKKLDQLDIPTPRHEPYGSPHDRFNYPQLLVVSGGIYREVFFYQEATAHGVPFAAPLVNH
jgi:hypothetical protein